MNKVKKKSKTHKVAYQTSAFFVKIKKHISLKNEIKWLILEVSKRYNPEMLK